MWATSYFAFLAFPDRGFLIIVQAGGQEVWQAVMTMVKNISEVVLTSLPNFWRIARAFIDGKFKKVFWDLRDPARAPCAFTKMLIFND